MPAALRCPEGRSRQARGDPRGPGPAVPQPWAALLPTGLARPAPAQPVHPFPRSPPSSLPLGRHLRLRVPQVEQAVGVGAQPQPRAVLQQRGDNLAQGGAVLGPALQRGGWRE